MTYYNGIIDTHAHYDDERFAEKLDEILAVQKEHGIEAIIENSSDLPSSRNTIALAEKYDFIYGAVGVHPEEAGNLPEDWLKTVEEMTKQKKIVAIGEIGLDYHYEEPGREVQQKVFEQQLKLAADLDMPVEIHDRDAHGDILETIKKFRPKGTVHRFSGSPEMAKEIVKTGMVLGIGGALTYKNSKKERATVEQIPLDFLVLETDCPYLAPQQFRGQLSTSDMIPLVVDMIAEIKKETPEKVVEITTINAKRVFDV